MTTEQSATSRSLFDGLTLDGWHAMPRLPVAVGPGWPEPDSEAEREHRRLAKAHAAQWHVIDGAIVGRQAPGGAGYGGYLVTDDVFADFELSLHARPDWPADTGVLLRTTPLAAQGYQVLLDHRRSGGIAGFYGNGIGGFHALAWTVDVQRDSRGRPIRLVQEEPHASLEPVTSAKMALLSRAAPASEVLSVWRWDDWNELVIRCEGRHPTITTWINGLLVSQVVTSDLPPSVYDAAGVERVLSPSGHIALEVHDHDRYLPPGVDPAAACHLGAERWGPDATCRWRDLRLRSL